MKVSNYNFLFDYRGVKLAFNSMTCAMAIADSGFMGVLADIEAGHFDGVALSETRSSLIQEMKKGGYIIDDCFDELEFLRFRSFQGKFHTNSLSLAIAPTFLCNFDCPYCYEKTRESFMQHDVAEAICREVEKAARQQKKIQISWYGGEPLLAKNVVWALSERFIACADQHSVEYTAQMITNGYLLDDATIEKLKKSRVSRIQITLDGPAETHNSRRKLKNSSQPTFWVILAHAKKALDAGIGVAIRINIDKTNQDRVDGILDILLDYGLNNAYVYLGHVKASTEHCHSISNQCLSVEEFSMRFAEFEKKLIRKGFNPDYYPNYPRIKSNNCTADSISACVIAPDGSLFKCWHDLSNSDMSIGNIQDPLSMNDHDLMTQVKYMLSSPFDQDECRACNVLPICMGGCPSTKNLTTCQSCKYSLLATLKTEYDQFLVSTRSAGLSTTGVKDEAKLLFIKEPLKHCSSTCESNCYYYNASCGTPKRWWNM